MDELLYFTRGNLYVHPSKLRWELLKKTHDSKWAGHLVEERTLTLFSQSFHWLKDMQAYVKTCHSFQVDKTKRKKEVSLLQPQPVLEWPWKFIFMDFFSGFPKVEGFKFDLVMVDRFFKYYVFITAPSECQTEEVVRIFVSNVVKHFRKLEDIVTD